MKTNQLFNDCNSWNDFQIKLLSLQKKEKGDAFEFLTKLYFKIHPVYSFYDDVWLLNDIPITNTALIVAFANSFDIPNPPPHCLILIKTPVKTIKKQPIKVNNRSFIHFIICFNLFIYKVIFDGYFKGIKLLSFAIINSSLSIIY